MLTNVKPIETSYKGHRFRSRAEARWAVFFDAAGIRYLYEPEGFRMSDGTNYLPDFYLPDCKMWFEVKGVLDSLDEHKIYQFIKDSGMPVVIGYADLTFSACDNYSYPGVPSYERAERSGSWLCRCRECGTYCFMGNVGFTYCPNCGASHEKDHHMEWLLTGDSVEETDMEAFKKARSARFEHGETA